MIYQYNIIAESLLPYNCLEKIVAHPKARKTTTPHQDINTINACQLSSPDAATNQGPNKLDVAAYGAKNGEAAINERSSLFWIPTSTYATPTGTWNGHKPSQILCVAPTKGVG